MQLSRFLNFLLGRDVNALTREYFLLGIAELKNFKLQGTHSLLEGTSDYLLPTCDSMLKASGYYRLLGKFMAHAAVHVGVAFIGLSSAAIKYIFGNEDMEGLTLSTLDIPDYDSREIMVKVRLNI